MWSRSTEVRRLKNSQVGELAGVGVVGAPDPRQQPRQRVDRDRVPGLDRRLRDQHRERRLAGPTSPSSHRPRPSAMLRVEVVDERRGPPRRTARDLRVARHVGDRRAVEAHALVLRRQHRAHAARPRLLDPPLAALARAGDVVGVDDPAAAVAGAERADARQPLDLGRRSTVGDVDERRRPLAGAALARPRSARERSANEANLLLEDELHGVDRAVAVLAHDQLGDALELRPLGLGRRRRRRSSCSSPRGR